MNRAPYLNPARAEIANILGEIGLDLELLRPLAHVRRIGQRKKHDFLAGDGADVVVHTHDPDPGDVQDDCLQKRPRGFKKVSAHLFKEVSSLLGRQRLDQVLFGRGQDALEADKENFVDQMRADVFGAPADVFLRKPTDPFTDGRFNFPLRFHGGLESVPSPVRESWTRFTKELAPTRVVGAFFGWRLL
jgi:hypothetical protein